MNYFYKLLLKALLVTLLLNSDKILSFAFDMKIDFTSFSDVDEPYYLQDSLFSGQDLSSDAIYNEHSNDKVSLLEQSKTRPSFLLSYLLGKFAAGFNLSAYELGFLLDLFFPFVSFVIMVLLFRLISFSSAELAALCFTLHPYLFAIDSYVVSNIQFFSNFESVIISPMDCPPVMRAIATQASYPFFLLSIYFNIIFCLRVNKKSINLDLIYSAVLNGLCWYLYFFAWGAAFAVNSLFLLIWNFYNTKELQIFERIKNNLTVVTSYVVINLTVSAFGLYLLSFSSFDGRLQIDYYPKITYFNIEIFLIAILLFFCFRESTLKNFKIGLLLAATTLLSQMPLMNVGPVLNSFTADYHFPQLFLQPLFTGVICALLFDYIKRTFKSRRIYKILAYTAFLTIILSVPLRFYNLYNQAEGSSDYSNLFEYASKVIPKDKVFALPTRIDNPDLLFDLSGIPHFFNAITNHRTVNQLWASVNVTSLKESAERELLLGFLYTGDLNFTWECPVNKKVVNSDHLISAGPLLQSIMNNMCDEKNSYLAEHQSLARCDLLKKYSVDYLITYKKSSKFDKNFELERFLELNWDSHNNLQLYKFDRGAAISHYCNI